jgi:alcohol dehydrogenase (cytochrome c)
VKPRERFTGGSGNPMQQTTGSIKALDPVTGETKAVVRTDLPNWSGVLATGGNLVFSGLWEGALVAYDGKTLQELWRFDTGCGVMAPPVSYAVNGKQYVAVAVGPKWQANTRPAQLKLANACSMVYVFTL